MTKPSAAANCLTGIDRGMLRRKDEEWEKKHRPRENAAAKDALRKADEERKQKEILDILKRHLFIEYDRDILVISNASNKEIRIVTNEYEDKLLKEWLEQ